MLLFAHMAKPIEAQPRLDEATVRSVVREDLHGSFDEQAAGNALRHRELADRIEAAQNARRRTFGGFAERAARYVGNKLAPKRVDSYTQVERKEAQRLQSARHAAERQAMLEDPEWQAVTHDRDRTHKMRGWLDTGTVREDGVRVLPYQQSPYVRALESAARDHSEAERMKRGERLQTDAAFGPLKMAADYEASLTDEQLAERAEMFEQRAAEAQAEAMDHLRPQDTDLNGRYRSDRPTLSDEDAWLGMMEVARQENAARDAAAKQQLDRNDTVGAAK